jgi:bacillithiol biosynthesis cysteine-adding enzyme BshC
MLCPYEGTVTQVLSVPYTHLSGFSRSWTAVTSQSMPPDLYVREAASLSACRAAAEETLRFQRPWKQLADLFERSGRGYGVPRETLARLPALAEGKAVMVVTGQQVGYLGGPLYTFLKAYHATRLAQFLERELQRPVLACFWLEGEDHDLEEVRYAHYLSRAGELQTLRFSPDKEVAGFQVGRYEVDAGAHLEELAQALDTAYEDALGLLREAYAQTTLSEGMGRLLARTLGSRGLFVIEGMEPELKAMALPLWEKVIARGRGLTEILEERSTELRASGWDAPLSPTRDAYLFYLCGPDHVRCPLTYDRRLRHPAGEVGPVSLDTLLSSVRQQPSLVSPKAALRPLYQDFVLPTVAYVAGPGELDYHAQLTPFYAELEVCAPVLFPRLSATILDNRTARLTGKLEVPLERLLSDDPAALQRALLAGEDEANTAEVFAEAKRHIEEVFAKLKTKFFTLDPTLAEAAQAGAGKSLHPIEQLREKAQRALKQKHATALSRLDKCLAALRPRGELSERVFSTGYYLAQYGLERLLNALDELPVELPEHAVIEL